MKERTLRRLHRSPLNRMEENRKWLMLWSCVGVYMVYYLTPDDKGGALLSLFPFSEQQLTMRSYVYFACVYVSRMLFVLTISEFAVTYRKSFQVLFWLEAIAVVNFFTRYGEDFYYPGFDMMTIRFFVWGIVAAVNIFSNFRKFKYDAK